MATYTFNTLADMKKSTALQIDDIVYTRGRESINDGKGEKYKIIADGIGQDGTDYIRLTGTNLKAELFETARQYGNQILQGSTDDPLLLGSDSETYPAGTYARDINGIIKRAIAEFDNGDYSTGEFDANFEEYSIETISTKVKSNTVIVENLFDTGSKTINNTGVSMEDDIPDELKITDSVFEIIFARTGSASTAFSKYIVRKTSASWVFAICASSENDFAPALTAPGGVITATHTSVNPAPYKYLITNKY